MCGFYVWAEHCPCMVQEGPCVTGTVLCVCLHGVVRPRTQMYIES